VRKRGPVKLKLAHMCEAREDALREAYPPTRQFAPCALPGFLCLGCRMINLTDYYNLGIVAMAS
jgi:hypothetical protein